jgi:hypothetical protein
MSEGSMPRLRHACSDLGVLRSSSTPALSAKRLSQGKFIRASSKLKDQCDLRGLPQKLGAKHNVL